MRVGTILRAQRVGAVGPRPLKLDVRRSMSLSLSRTRSLIVVAVAYLAAWPIPNGLWIVTLVSVPLLGLIWFPQQLDDLTFGTWYRGYQIDSHTPGVAIAALGWVFLLLFTVAVFFARHAVR